MERNGFSLPTQDVYCPRCFDLFFADGPDHECHKCGLKFDLRDPNLLGVVVKEYRKKAHVRFILNDLEQMQKLVNGNIEAVYWGEALGKPDYFLICNEEGKYIADCLPNIELPHDIVMGTVFVTKINGEGNNVSVSKQDVLDIIFSLESRAYSG